MNQLELIQSKIFEIRGQKVMIDRDLAELYNVETKRLNEQVKRNIHRFPDDFMFKLTADECLRSQIATSNDKPGRGGHRYLPYAFTEQGISMLSSVLKSDTAIEVNIRIMRAFVAMRHFMMDNARIFHRLESIEHNQLLLHSGQTAIQERLSGHDRQIEEIFQSMANSSKTPRQGVFFNGQIYDAYTFVADLVRQAKSRIILIDNYVDDSVLTILDKRMKDVDAKIFTSHFSKQLRLDLERHNAQYAPIEIKLYDKSHDRFLIVDEEVYHIGASVKDLGKKLFAFSLMQELSAEELMARITTDM